MIDNNKLTAAEQAELDELNRSGLTADEQAELDELNGVSSVKKKAVTSPSRLVSGTSVSTEKPSAYAPQSLSKETNIPFKKSEPVAAATVADDPAKKIELDKSMGQPTKLDDSGNPIINKGTSVSKIKDENIKRLDFQKADILKQQMEKDLAENPSPAYRKQYIETLAKKGYNKKELEQFNVQPEKKSVSAFEKYGREYDVFAPITDWSVNFAKKTLTALGDAGETFNKGVSNLIASTSEGSASEDRAREKSENLSVNDRQNISNSYVNSIKEINRQKENGLSQEDYDIKFEKINQVRKQLLGKDSETGVEQAVKGGLQVVTGNVEALFNLLPAAVTFNAGIDAINTVAEKNLSSEQAQVVEKVTSLPFTMVTSTMDALGIKPEEGSSNELVANLLNFVAIAGASHASGSAFKGVKEKIKSIKDLKEISKNSAEGKLTPEEQAEFKRYSDGLSKVTLTDIKIQAEKLNTPEAKKIVERINSILENAKPEQDALHTELATLIDTQNKLSEGIDKQRISELIDYKEQEIKNKQAESAQRDIEEAKNNAKIGVEIEEIDNRLLKLREDKKNNPVDEKTGENKEFNDFTDNIIKNLEKQKQDAIQKQSTGGLLQSKTEGTGEPGGKRGTLEQGVEGAEAAEIQKEREEKLKPYDERDASSLEAAMPDNPNHPTFKVGMKFNEGMDVIVEKDTADNWNGEGEGYIAITKVIKPAEFGSDGKMTKAAQIETETFNSKEAADKAIKERYEKVKSKAGEKQKEINAEYDAKLADSKRFINAGSKKTVAGVELVEPSYKEHNDLVAERNTPEWTQNEVAKLEESDAIDIAEIERKAKADEDFAILTGTNPEGKAHTDIENAKLQEKAVKWLEDKGYKPKKVVGKYGQGEASLFVDKMTLEDAAEFRKEFQQESVAHSKAMVYDGKYIERVKAKDDFNIGEFKKETDSATAVRQTDGTTKGFKLDYDWENYKPIKEIIAEKAEMKAEKAEIKAEKAKPEPLTKSEKAKYDILKSKEKRGKATDADKANIAKYDKKIDQAGIVERTKSAVSNVIKALKKIVPTLEVKTYETTKEFEAAAREQAFTEEYYKLKEKQEIGELTLEEIQKIKDIENEANSSIKAGGLFDGKTIHLNLEKIKTNSLFHEAVHPILNAINAVNPKAISRIFEQVKTVEKKLGIEGKYTEEFASNYEQSRKEMEAITEFIADVADGNIEITKSNFDFIKKAFVDMMRYFGVDLSSSIKTVGELKTLAENIAYSFETGTELSISKKGKSGFLDTSGKPLSISDMQYSIHNDFSDAVTRMTFEYLANAEKFKKLQEAGFITDNKTFDEYNKKYVFFHSPDGAFTGMIFKDGQLMVEGKGGLYYPIRFHEDGYFWASTENAANGMVAQFNAQAKLNGGKIFMALTSAPIDKLLSNTTFANGVMDLFLSKILDKKTNISKSIVRKAIFDAAHADSAILTKKKLYLKEDLKNSKKNEKLKIKNEKLKQEHGEVFRDKKGEYVYKEEVVGLRLSSLDLKGDLDQMVSTIRKKLGADNSSFKDRKHFSETLMTLIAKEIKGTPAEQSLGEFLHIGISNLDMKNVTKKGYNLSKANISAAISHMFHEPLIRPEAEAPLKKGEKAKKTNGRVYAVLELECKPEKIRLEGKTKKEIKALTKMYGEPIKDSTGSYVEAYVKAIDSNKHESYPKAIVAADGKAKTKVHVMQDREFWHENVLDPETGERPTEDRAKSIMPSTVGATNTSLLVSARVKGEGEVSGKAEAETTSKAGTDPVAKAGKRKEMTEDDKGNYLFFHYSDAKFNKLNPEKVGKHLATSRGETPAKKMSMLYTRPDRLEPGVPSSNGYVVRVPKDKVYHFNTDPLNLLPEAEKLFRKENGKDKSFDLNNQVAYVAKVAAEKGFPVTTSDWNIKGTKALRAQTTEVLPVEKYSNIKPGTTNQIQFNPEFENVKPNAKRKDLYYSLEGESLETALDRALETAKNSSISKGLAEFKESEYFKKQDKEIQAELEDYFKEEAGPVEKGGLEDKFDALDDIANKLKEPLTKSEINELTSKRKAIFDENPEVKEINDNFSKITRQLEENGELKKSRKDCP